ncbi:hypothetical protein [Algoriphagus namhaensis]
MTFLYFILIPFLYLTSPDLEGRWQLIHVTGFDTILDIPELQDFSEEEKLKVLSGFDYVLENTSYTFRGDSVFYANAGPNFTTTEWKGRYLMKADTIFIFYSNKVNPVKLFISSNDEHQLNMRVVHRGGELGPVVMTFEREVD